MNGKVDFSTHIVRILFILIVAGFVVFVIYGLTALSIQFLLALIIAFLLTPAVNSLEGFGIPRFFAVLFILLLGGGAIYLLLHFLLPPVMIEVKSLLANIDAYKGKLARILDESRFFIESALPEYQGAKKIHISTVEKFMQEQSDSMDIGSYIPTIFTSSIITPIILVVFLVQGPQIFRNILAMVPNRYFEMSLQLAYRIRRQISSYLLGMFFQWLILFIILLVGFISIKLPYAPLVALLAASANALPYLGPVLGLIPAIFMALTVPALLVPTLIVFGVAQVVDNAFNQPVLLARSVQIHPLIAILAFITFSELLGIMGMVIAIPLAGMILVTIQIMYRSLKAFKII